MEKINISKIQEQFWILNFLHKNNTVYNIPSVFKIDGIPNIEYLQNTIEILIQRHELLRTVFFLEKGNVFQKLDGLKHVIAIKVVELPSEFIDNNITNEINEEIHTQFDLTGGCLFRVTLFIYQNNISVLTIVFHHIIVDLHSKNIFAKEFSELYNSFCQDKPIILTKNNFNYFDYVEWYTKWLETPIAEKMLDYWLKEIEGINNNDWYPSRQDRTHDISIVLMYDISKRLNVSAVWVYQTGNAVTFPSGKYEVAGQTIWLYTERNAYRMPDYHRLDLGLTYKFKEKKHFNSELAFGLYNAYGRENAYLISFDQSESDPNKTVAKQTSLFRWVPSISWNFKF